jgi:hypothetical protein
MMAIGLLFGRVFDTASQRPGDGSNCNRWRG